MKQNSNNKRERKKINGKNKKETDRKVRLFHFSSAPCDTLFLLNGTGPAVLPYLFFLSIYSTIASRVSIYLWWYGEYSK